MKDLNRLLEEYIVFVTNHKRLDKKTIKAYRIDLRQFMVHLNVDNNSVIDELGLRKYIQLLNSKYQARTVKRKLASIRAYIGFLNENKYLDESFDRVFKVKLREPKKLPKTINLHNLNLLFGILDLEKKVAKTVKTKECIIRDIAIIELLFSTGMRISELCYLKKKNLDIKCGVVRIDGKGAKERIINIGNPNVISALSEYDATIIEKDRDFFFLIIGGIQYQINLSD